jgi:hypothetical protein
MRRARAMGLVSSTALTPEEGEKLNTVFHISELIQYVINSMV